MSGVNFAALVVDDETDQLEAWKAIIEELGFEPLLFSSPLKALEVIATQHERLVFVLSDFRMPEMDGLEFRRRMLPQFQSVPFIIVTGYLSKATALEGIDAKISAFLEKPQTKESIRPIIEKVTTDRMVAIRDDLEMRKGFWVDAKELLKEIEAGVLVLEQDPNSPDILPNMMRMLHTIKGTASCLDMHSVKTFSHAFEDFVTPFRNGNLIVNKMVVTLMLKAYDILCNLVDRAVELGSDKGDAEELKKIFNVDWKVLQTQAKATLPSSDAALPSDAGGDGKQRDEEIRVSTKILDEFMELSGELTVNRSFVVKHVQLLEQKYGQTKEIELLTTSIGEMQKISSIMQQRIEEVRKVPLKNVLRQLTRAVRDVCRGSGKEVRLEIRGDNIRVDTSISNVLSASLVHMVRNSVDHGIESSEDRLRVGKKAEGVLLIQCSDRGENILVEISDDGRGLNVDRIKAKAVERLGYTQPQVDALPRGKLFSLIFESGFSTAEKVTEISGRGVGMDMVRTSVTGIGGHIDIFSDEGLGTRFVLTLPKPRSALIMRGLFVGVGDETFCISHDDVAKVLSLGEKERSKLIRFVDNKEFFLLEGKLSPILNLRNYFEITASDRWKNINEDKLIVLRLEQGKFVVRVDEILDSDEIVLKPLDRTLGTRRELLGATFVGEQVALVLSAEGLASAAAMISGQVDEIDLVDQMGGALDLSGDSGKEYLMVRDLQGAKRALPIEIVERLDEIKGDQIEAIGQERMVRLRGEAVPVLELDLGTPVKIGAEETVSLILISGWARRFGFLVREVLDIVTASGPVNTEVLDQGLSGTVLVGELTLPVVDSEAVLRGRNFLNLVREGGSRRVGDLAS